MSESMCWQCEKRPVRNPESGQCWECWRDVQHKARVEQLTPKAADALETLRRIVNDRAGVEALQRALEREHRTNQQLICRAVVALLEKWDADGKKGPGWYDLRNEASVKFAEAVFKNVPEKLRYFPYY